jgi:glycosyltransferase involved in cell wall biosynthesis
MQKNWDTNMETIKLSYVITTFNKLKYLKFVMADLLENIQADEEIVVVDGGSKDGTQEYLKSLFDDGKIHQYKSEPDKGEAHGFNKGMLMAKGELIKILTDDDSFYYPGIWHCKNYMLENPNVDVLASNVATTFLFNDKTISFDESHNKYSEAWSTSKIKNFPFIGLGIMIRRSSIPLTGLFNTTIKLVDSEFSLRVTTNANFVWYTGVLGIRAGNINSNYHKFFKQIVNESRNNFRYYSFDYYKIVKRQKRSLKDFIILVYYPIIAFYRRLFSNGVRELTQLTIDDYYSHYKDWLMQRNKEIESKFISKIKV